MQNAALVKWKTPEWVPAEARLLVRPSDPKAPARLNTPQSTDSPEEWARWLWRYPREAMMHPGILRAQYGINMSMVRGLVMVMARAPQGAIALRT